LPAGSFALAPVYRVYTRRLRSSVLSQPLPHHVAVILDGNRRWASLAG
jgi:undecaprenyl pyrophosphate synthase